ncbi:response regulator [Paraflavisolibacter sp. H34]|uniref:response regulator n=1 Tax=Huijunlia imazamoxiresistens TaxID=3127457 RepID=UPI0030189436
MDTESRYILMVEDDPDDRYITQQTLQDIGRNIAVTFLTQSDKVFPFLERQELPAVILVDYDISPGNGLELLQELKRHPKYGHIPVIILGESDDPDLVRECYRQGANSFVAKPSTFGGTVKKIEHFFTYWLEIAELG